MRTATAVTARAIFVLGLATPAWAGPTALGPPFRVSACSGCRQEWPGLAGAPSGGFLAVWEGSSATDVKGISGRFFTAAGSAQTADLLVSNEVAPDQFDAAVVRDANGNFIVAWSAVANGNSEIMGQRFQATGTALGAAFKVSLDPPGSPTIPADFHPAIAATRGGGFVVAWMNRLPAGISFPGTSPQVLARRFNASGAPLGSPTKINTGLVNGDRPSVCVDTAGKIVAAWTSADAFRPFEPTRLGISLRRLSAAGAPLGPEQVVAAPKANAAQGAVSCGNGSTFVVVWQSDQAPAVDQADVLGQRFSRLGRAIGPVFRVNTLTALHQLSPAIAHDPQGNFFVVWQGSNAGHFGIYGRRFAANGTAAGPDVELVAESPTVMQPVRPRLAFVGAAGTFVVVWQDKSKAIYGRRFAP